ncbi:hypothetical protein ACFL1G_02210 [Planctomycetota bacterium]
MNYKKYFILSALSVALLALLVTSPIYAEDRFADPSIRQKAIELGNFIQIPGPNPIIRTGPQGAWDDENTETGDAFEDLGTYYLYYHSMNTWSDFKYQYQIGVATAVNPLGPFTKHGNNPILTVGAKESWEDGSVACPMVLKEGDKKYLMWYWGLDDKPAFVYKAVGLATAPTPLGPWKKYEGNPVLKDVGYVGGVVKTNGKYYIYSAHSSTYPGYKSDYGPIIVAVADKPEGPYVKYTGNPVLAKGSPGNWDDGGISEAEVLYHNGMFHMFYGGTRIHGPRLESIGYAYSFDGFEWTRYGKNPVATRHANPNAAAFAEVHAIIEMPFIYLYHTLRPETHPERNPMDVEHLGVQVLATQRPFSIDMPALYIEGLAAGETTKMDDSPPIALSNITGLSLTAECKYSKDARKPIRVHVRASYDGLKYDTADLYTLDNILQPDRLARKTFQLDTKVRFIKVTAENLDDSEGVSEVKIIATLSG